MVLPAPALINYMVKGNDVSVLELASECFVREGWAPVSGKQQAGQLKGQADGSRLELKAEIRVRHRAR